MNTPSHVIVNAALRKVLRKRISIPASAFLIGGFMPDVPLGIISIGSLLYFRYVQGLELSSVMNQMFDDFYFNNPWWIASHNFLHSPTLLLIFLALLWPFRARSGTRRYWLFWFFAGCLLHTALDIPTHVRDGPVIFFPFDWHYRFQSTISYWDPRYFGREFTVFEIGLNIVLLLYLLVPWFWGRLQQRRGGSPTPEQPT